MMKMVLVDKEIKKVVQTGEIEISDFAEDCLNPASYDLRLGEEAYTLSAGKIISVKEKGFVEIQPGDFALIITHEKLRLPINFVGRFGLRSKYARMGLIMTAGPQVDPGFEGKLVFGVVNFSSQIIRLKYLEPICTLELERLSTSSSTGYRGPYQGQMRITDEHIASLPKEPYPLAVMLIRQLMAVSPTMKRKEEEERIMPPRDIETEIFQREKEAFNSLKHELLKTHRGEYVVIHGGKPVLFGRNKTELAKEAYRKFGYVPLYIGLVREEPEVVHLSTPRTSRERI